MVIKITLLLVFFAVMVGIGLYCRRHATNVSGFVLGGRSVGPWLTAFAYGTSYFSAVVFVGYAGQFGWKYGIAATWAGIGNACWPGPCWAAAPASCPSIWTAPPCPSSSASALAASR